MQHGQVDSALPAWASPPRRNGKISHLLASDLRRKILSGRLAADQQLPSEAELTTAFNVSRETLREALRILESQSLVEVRRGRGGGTVVRRPGLAAVGRYVALLLQLRNTTLADLEEARSVLEPPAAEQFAMRCDAKELEALVRLHDAERAAENDPLAFVTAVASFDQAVCELSGERSLAVVAGVLRDIYAGQVYAAIDTSDRKGADDIARRVVVSHTAVIEAARRGDGPLARKAWVDYLATTSRLLVSRSRSRRSIDVVPLWRAQDHPDPAARPQRLAAAVAGEIRARIAEGRLADGDRLPGLPDLAEEFGVSRPTLREALRILEMEFLVDLRSGDRNGPRVRAPSAQIAAQLAGTLFEARQTTIGDFYRAVTVIEPAMMQIAAERITPKSLATLDALQAEFAASTHEVAGLLSTWSAARDVAFGATKNPALTVVAEILQWVRVGTQPAMVTGAASDHAWVSETHHLAALFTDLVAAFAARDGDRAAAVWADSLDANSPYLETSGLGRRLVIDLVS